MGVWLLRGNVKRFRGRLVFKAHRLVYHSTLGSRVIKKKKKKKKKRPPLPMSSENGACKTVKARRIGVRPHRLLPQSHNLGQGLQSVHQLRLRQVLWGFRARRNLMSVGWFVS